MRRHCLWTLLAGACGAGLAPWPALAADAEVWIVCSAVGGVHAETAQALQQAWARESRLTLGWRVVTWSELPLASGPLPQLIVTLGSGAYLEWIERTQASPALARVPMLAALLPQASYPVPVARVPGQTSAIFLDQPAARIARLLQLALPEFRRVGVLFGPDSLVARPALSRALSAQGFKLVEQTVLSGDKGIYPALRSLFDDADLLLAMPDKRVYSVSNMHNILLAAYRQRVPVVSYSAAHVRAGALLALHTEPASVGQQLAGALRQWQAGRGLPPPAMADGYAVALNDQVARSLDLSLPNAEALLQALKLQESAR